MNKRIVNLWADIGSDSYWKDVMKEGAHVFVPFKSRWPQPGFIGNGYFSSPKRVIVMGQNPRAGKHKNPVIAEKDEELFEQIRQLANHRSVASLNKLFAMMMEFFSFPDERVWRPLKCAKNYLGLDWNSIAYLNLIPLATYNDRIVPEFRKAFELSTKQQLDVLAPAKIVVVGKGAHDKFNQVLGGRRDSRYIEPRNPRKDAPSVKQWLKR